jgi:alkylation response protein AidB-like acyl-CoA dehydrogenase
MSDPINGGLDFALGEMADTIRDTTQRFAADRIAPLAARIDEEDWFPRELWPKWASSGSTASRWRKRMAGWARLSRACRGAGGSGARLGLDRAELRRAFEPVRQPDQALGEP